MSMPNTLEVAKEHLFSSEDEMVRAGNIMDGVTLSAYLIWRTRAEGGA